MFSSSNFHFILICSEYESSSGSVVEEETSANMQLLALLFMYPMASVDLYVHDVVWYIRHHYPFYLMLKASVYDCMCVCLCCVCTVISDVYFRRVGTFATIRLRMGQSSRASSTRSVSWTGPCTGVALPAPSSRYAPCTYSRPSSLLLGVVESRGLRAHLSHRGSRSRWCCGTTRFSGTPPC